MRWLNTSETTFLINTANSASSLSGEFTRPILPLQLLSEFDKILCPEFAPSIPIPEMAQLTQPGPSPNTIGVAIQKLC